MIHYREYFKRMWLPLILSVIAVSSISCNPFMATISTSDRYEAGTDITCKVVIANNKDRDYYLLKRNTPLAELASHSFQITHYGKLVPYDGLLYKRTPPTSEDFLLVPAKSSVSTSTDLSQFYSLKSNTLYKVTLKAMITFYERNISDTKSQYISSNEQLFSVFGNVTMKLTEAQVVRSKIKHQESRIISKPENYTQPSIDGTPKRWDSKTLLKVYRATYKNLAFSIESVDSNIVLYTKFFGFPYVRRMNIVRDTYSKIKNGMETEQFTFHFDGSYCGLDAAIVAYTCKSCTTIYLCKAYRKQPALKGTDTKLGTFIHELSHAAGHTDDVIYGSKRCRALAKYQPEVAVYNADNYHYFSEPLSQ